MDPDKPRLADLASGHSQTTAAENKGEDKGLPSASSSYPYSAESSIGQQPIQYPTPSAPPAQDDDEQSEQNQQVAATCHARDGTNNFAQPQAQHMPPETQQQQTPPHQHQIPQHHPGNAPGATNHYQQEQTRNQLMRRGPITIAEKSLFEAYILCIPFGFLGLHHFYLGRIGMGFLYFFTWGLFGIGWIVDWFRLPWLVKQTNEKRRADAERGYVLYGGPFDELYERSMGSAYLFWLPPVGIFGGHHYYLGRIGFGIVYTLTMGLFGVGWLLDFCRIWVLTKRANEEIRTLRSGQPLPMKPGDRMYLDDAYFLAFPLGFLGLHHFYMRRWIFGITYFLTLGCMGVGYLVDICRLPYLFHRTKRELEDDDEKFHLDDAYLMWFPLGVIGLHHFYLHRWFWGFTYLFTFGLMGIGWLIDFCRLPYLVKLSNDRRDMELLRNQYHPDVVPRYGADNNAPVTQGTDQGSHQPMPTTHQHRPVAVYAFPLDEHGHPIWNQGTSWTQDPGSGNPSSTMQQHWQPGITGSLQEPPPPYSPT